MKTTSKNQKGLAALEIILIIGVLAVIGAVGWRYYDAHKTIKVTTTAVTNPGKPKPVDPTATWTNFVSVKGEFSLKHPSSWKTTDCSTGGNAVVFLAPSGHAAVCNSGQSAQIFGSSDPSNPQIPKDSIENPCGGPGDCGRAQVGIQSVVVDKIPGKRITSKESGIAGRVPDPKVSFVTYIFFANGRTYDIEYTYDPSVGFSTNALTDFDLMVKNTLKFSAH